MPPKLSDIETASRIAKTIADIWGVFRDKGDDKKRDKQRIADLEKELAELKKKIAEDSK